MNSTIKQLNEKYDLPFKHEWEIKVEELISCLKRVQAKYKIYESYAKRGNYNGHFCSHEVTDLEYAFREHYVEDRIKVLLEAALNRKYLYSGAPFYFILSAVSFKNSLNFVILGL